jgi:hypothetical protein
MRLSHSVALARMLLTFFRRRVLRAGVLRSAPVRILAVSGVAVLLVAASAAAYSFLQPMAGDPALWRLLFDTATVSLVLWAQIAFLLVKTLFLNAEGLLELSFQLPITNRERSAAFMMYEASMTAVVVGAGAVSLTVTALLLLGPAAVPRLLESIIFPAVLTYLGLSVIYLLLMRVFGVLRLRPIANVLLVLVMFGLLTLYSTRMMALVSAVSQAYLDGRDSFVWVTSVSWLARQYGSLPALAIATLLALALMCLVMWLTPSQHVRHSRYLNVPVGGWLRRVLGPYDWCLLRNSQTVVAVSIALALFGYLALARAVNPMWSFSVLSLGGLYQFAATEPLRVLVGSTTSPWRVYGRLLRAQLILMALFFVPALVTLTVVDARLVAQSPPALLGCVGGAIVTTCIGIVFPAEKDNPFSVFIGLSVTAVILALVAIGMGMLRLPPSAVIASLVGASALFVWYSVQGIRTSESRRRNEKGTVGRELRRRGRSADLGDSRGHFALPHVLDG